MKCMYEKCDNELSGYFQKKYCSISCAAKVNNRGVRRHGKPKPKNNCLNCGKRISSTAKKYCNNKCQNEFQYKNYIMKWKSGDIAGNESSRGDVPMPIRKYLRLKFNNSCQKCGWNEVNPWVKSGLPILEIEHKDGNCDNNRPENLELLCRNCHSLTPTFGRLNESGQGRRAKGYL